jgi:hypothetical protein
MHIYSYAYVFIHICICIYMCINRVVGHTAFFLFLQIAITLNGFKSLLFYLYLKKLNYTDYEYLIGVGYIVVLSLVTSFYFTYCIGKDEYMRFTFFLRIFICVYVHTHIYICENMYLCRGIYLNPYSCLNK